MLQRVILWQPIVRRFTLSRLIVLASIFHSRPHNFGYLLRRFIAIEISLSAYSIPIQLASVEANQGQEVSLFENQRSPTRPSRALLKVPPTSKPNEEAALRDRTMAPTDSTEDPTQSRPQYIKRLKSALKCFKEWTKSAVEQQPRSSPRNSTSNLSGDTLVGTEGLEASLEALHIWSA